MSLRETRKSSFVARIMTVLAITLTAIFSVLVVLGATEINKIFPNTPTRSLAILLGSIVPILTSNYFLAIRGRNFINWETELLISLNFILLYSVILLPWLFPLSVEAEHPWYMPFFDSTNRMPNYWFFGIFILLVPLLFVNGKQVRAYLLSEKE